MSYWFNGSLLPKRRGSISLLRKSRIEQKDYKLQRNRSINVDEAERKKGCRLNGSASIASKDLQRALNAKVSWIGFQIVADRD